MVWTLTDSETSKAEISQSTQHWVQSLADTVIVIGVIFVSALAVAAVAIAAPFVLVISALTGLMTKNSPSTGWRSAGA